MKNRDFPSRNFNRFSLSDNVLTKTSTDVLKISSEYSYYYLLPTELQSYFVKPQNLVIMDQYASYDMQVLDTKNAGQILSSGDMNIGSFSRMLDKIVKFKEQVTNEIFSVEDVLSESRGLVIEKTKRRILNLFELSVLLDRIESAYNFYKEERSVWEKRVSHGDLCLSNILWVENQDLIKFVDPRGAINKKDICMDEYYDLAKLSQSILGGYENIIYDSEYQYPEIQIKFVNFLIEMGISLNLVRVYEASLFLSMIPLHRDRQDHVEEFVKACDRILQEVGF